MTSRIATSLSRLLVAAPIAVAMTTALQATDGPRENGLRIDGTLVAGYSYRTVAPDSSLLGSNNAALVGLIGTGLTPSSAQNGDDGNLNFRQGDPVSEVFKAYVTLSYRQGDYGFVLSGKGWYDGALAFDGKPWGNAGNGHVAGATLSDAGVPNRAKFQGFAADNAYGFGHNELGAVNLDWRVGYQKLEWGHPFFILGGLRDLTPIDAPGQFRPGALRWEEGRIAIPLLFFRLGSASNSLEAFYQVKYQRNIVNVDGTFFSQNDYLSEGAHYALVGGTNERAELVSGAYVKRASSVDPSNSGEFGLAYKHTVESLGTEFGLYAAQFHARANYLGIIAANRAPAANGSLFVPVPQDVNNLNPEYFSENPEKIKMYGLTFETKWRGGSLFGEITQRPNEPMKYNANDILPAFLNSGMTSAGVAVSPTPLRAAANAVAPGGIFHAWERHKQNQAQLGISQQIPDLLGAKALAIGAEYVYKQIPDLPNPTITRFGRADIFGEGPVVGFPAPASPIASSLDGFVSKTAAAYRLRASLIYANVASGVDLTPSVFWGQDLSGWSSDGSILKGRKLAIVSIKATFAKSYFAEIAWQPTYGGIYNNMRDRGTAQINAGLKF